MPRTKGAINKSIHFKTREAFDFNLLCNEKEMMNGAKPPAFWFQRLIDLSNNPPYVIAFMEPRKIEFSSFNLADYIDENLKVKTDLQSKIDIFMPSGRNNNEIYSDVLRFTNSIAKFYLEKENYPSQSGIIKIRKDLLHLKLLCDQGMKNACNGVYNRKFLVSDGHTRIFHPVQSTANYFSHTDDDVRQKWVSSVVVLWSHLNHCVDRLTQIFIEPNFEIKIGYSKKNFDQWLEDGLENFLVSKDKNLIDEKLLINLLKWQILGKRELKTPKKIK